MTEPSRKANKNHIKSIPSPILVEGQALAEHPQGQNPLIFWTLHPTDPYLVDLTQFETGRTAAELTSGKQLWKGDFRGRPNLIYELTPAIKYLCILNRQASLQLLLEHLRFWWRVFEEAESENETSLYTVAPVHSVADLQLIHHHIAVNMGVTRMCHNAVIRILNLARSEMGFQPLHWPSVERKRGQSDAAESWEIELIRREFKKGWFAGLRRITAAEPIQANLMDWKITSPRLRKKHADEVYRAVIECSKHPIPSVDHVRKWTDCNHPTWMQPFSNVIANLYPTREEVREAFFLCLIYSGWNVSTLYNLSIEDRFVQCHPTNADYHVLYGLKHRGDSEHPCIGRNKRSDSPGQILRSLVTITAPLRRQVKKELAEVEAQLKKSDLTNSALNILLTKRKVLTHRVKSPWLYPDPHGFTVNHITESNLNFSTSGKGRAKFLASIIQKINLRQPPDKKIRSSIVPADLRHSYIGFAYEVSNYNILTAQIAAGHKSADTTTVYLDKKRWKAHSAKKIHEFQTVLFNEIEERKAVDVTILRANLEWGATTIEEIDRLGIYRKNRTRIGVACKDPKNPPLAIAPNHTDGGCRIQRCTLCPQNAILLPDSYDGIAMRVSELEYLRDDTPVPVWVNSLFPEELSNAFAILEQYDHQKVTARLDHWRSEIKEGRHKPITWEGV